MALRVLTILLLATLGRADDLTLRGGAMGTRWMVKVRASEAEDAEGLRAAVVGRLAEIDRTMSTWRKDSEISLFNASRSTNWFPVAPEFARVLRRGLEIARATDGAFDPTVLPLSRLWGFTTHSGLGDPPNASEIAGQLSRVGHDKIVARLKSPAVRKTDARTEIDLSAIAKGFAVDAVAELLARRWCTNWLVDIGGEVRGHGRSGKGRAWRIGIEAPIVGERRIHLAVEVADGAVATSGDYRNFIELAGRRHAHIIDARSGYPIPQRGLAVSVQAKDCLTADAWATALCVLGPERGSAIAEKAGIAALFLTTRKGKVQSRPTRHWRSLK